MAGRSLNQITKAVEDFVDAQTWDESKHIVETQRDKLLTDAADLILADLLELYRDDANATRYLADRRDLLARCRRDGIEAAFADRLLPEELQTLLSEIEQLSSPSDMSRRVMLCRTALRLLNRTVRPQLWAALQLSLADSLVQNPQGARGQPGAGDLSL